jgi:hypothetical protein
MRMIRREVDDKMAGGKVGGIDIPGSERDV